MGPLAEDGNLTTIFPEGRLRRDAKSQRNSYLTVNPSLKLSFIDRERVLLESRSEINRLFELVEATTVRSLVTRVLGLAIGCSASWFSQAAQPQPSPKVRNDDVTAAEVGWDYPPGGVMLWEESSSGYSNPNIQTFTSGSKGVKKFEFSPGDEEGNFASTGSGFTVAHAKFSSSGCICANTPWMTVKKGERVRCYLLGPGEQFSVHTPRGHGNVVRQDGKRTGLVSTDLGLSDTSADADGRYGP
jgi:hypothetical protein